MAFDNLCKVMAEENPQQFVLWLLGKRVKRVKVLKTELGIEPIRADSVTFLQSSKAVLHLEFQTGT
ncbi:MAG: Rpn family recombination-promoting nuclease/putative transposase [Pyrinomonadaceae bacterium]|nr:Rpn family recombination-promoting nuclease/putative transposase [Pyrinomonadaceae bacterium]